MAPETYWEVPAPLSELEVRLDDGSVTTVRRHGNPGGLRVVMSHGNGLAIDLYYPFWSLLRDEFDLFIYDLRNHGWNAVGPRLSHNVPTLIRDQDLVLEAIDRNFGKRPRIGIFHSVSALTTLFSSAQDGSFSALVLFDPPLCKPGASQIEFDTAAERLASRVRQRSRHFRSEAELAEILSYMPAYTRVIPGVCELVASTTLRESPSGQGYDLRCPPEYEAQIVEYTRSFSVLADLDTLSCPTKAIGADPTLPSAYLPTFDMSHILTVDYDFLPETTHLLQLEKPAECVASVREFLEGVGLL